MGLIGSLVGFSPGTKLSSSDMNGDLASIRNVVNGSCVMTDLSTTIVVSHSWTVSQNFQGGFTVATGQSIVASGVSITGKPNFTQGLTITSGQAIAATGASITIGALTLGTSPLNLTAGAPFVIGTTDNNSIAIKTNALNRWQADTSGNLLADTTNGGTVQSRLGTADVKHTFAPYTTGQVTTNSTIEGSLASWPCPAGALSANGHAVRIMLGYNYNAGFGAGFLLKVKFGATQLHTAITAIANATTERGFVTFVVSRNGATAQLATCHGVQKNAGATTALICDRAAPGETLSGAVTVDIRGNVGNAGDTLTLDWATIEVVEN